ncbi:class I SAM-dependent methyltransferase [Rhizobium wenxiniae]|uniref:class I SAM-dependent methyltransferase n=1 Tax=Rhizobium wenxiniae TaxID=1737357 RepID=UPI001C6DFA90|nr:class I SAM-dependent methyltransferase [Rhizobium wenxiniae]MBW9088155.1 class I SAM-dependent methyltransferase [Rhizobium wenxiniae]
MSASQPPSYNQPTKDQARRLSLTHAVQLVTSRRDAAAIVPSDHPERVREALLNSEIEGDQLAGEACEDEDLISWRTFRASAIGTRKPDEITIAYLAGPEPQNDLGVLLELGVRPENIWAFEVEEKVASQGLAILRELKARGVKFIPASIEDYFIGTPRRFDIVYFDACGPFPSRSSNTARVLATMFRHCALAPLGVLVSNFARPDVSAAEDLDRYSFLVAAYLYPKSFLESEEGGSVEGAQAHSYLFNLSREAVEEWGDDEPPEDFIDEVRANFDRYYGLFITRSLMDLATIIAPMARLLSSDLWKVAFNDDLKAAIARGKRLVVFNEEALGSNNNDEFDDPDVAVDETDDEMDVADKIWDAGGDLDEEAMSEHVDCDGDAIGESERFSLLWTLAACGFYPVDSNFGPPPAGADKLIKDWHRALVGKLPIPHIKDLKDLMAVYYAWREDHILWSEAMQRISQFPYRARMPFLCDVPTSEIGFYPTFAQLAYPTHPNVRETRRFRYVAETKVTPMFVDVIAFDECRYVHDWISALHLTPEDWTDLSAQLSFRFALDGIAKDKRWLGEDFLYGCHAVGESADFPASDLKLREDLSSGSTS